MTKIFHFDGIIKNVSYHAQLNDGLPTYDFADFDINAVDSQGIIKLPHGLMGYSKWDSPVEGKSYPFARIYNTGGSANRPITIVPVLKDDGIDGRLEHIQYSTLSWMNLANVYIVFSFFDKAVALEKEHQHRLIKQQLNNEIIKLQIEKLIPYLSSAIHWNRSQFGDNFKSVYQKAIRAYEKISERTKVEVHPRDLKLAYINKMRNDCRKYEGISIDGLKSADIEKDRRLHENKYEEGQKSVFYLVDGYGGIYYATTNDVWREQNIFVIQETRYSNKGFLPPLHQIQDGLFRLIFFGNIDSLYRNGHQVKFQTRLSLFGKNVRDALYLPCDNKAFRSFVRKNKNTISNEEKKVLRLLRAETEANDGLVVEIREKQ